MRLLLYILPLLTYSQATITKVLTYDCDKAYISETKKEVDRIRGNGETIIYLKAGTQLQINDNVKGVLVFCNATNDTINKPKIHMMKCEPLKVDVCHYIELIYPKDCKYGSKPKGFY